MRVSKPGVFIQSLLEYPSIQAIAVSSWLSPLSSCLHAKAAKDAHHLRNIHRHMITCLN